jgi:hypothetical protein
MGVGLETIHVLWLLAVPVGMVCCFLGYRVFKFVLGIFGFFGGLVLGNLLAVTFLEFEGVVLWILILAMGVIGAGLAVGLYFFGIFIAGAVSGGLLGSIISSQLTLEPLIVIIALGLFSGILALLLQKVIIIVSTALVGSWMAVSGGAYFLGRFDPYRFLQNPSSVFDSFENKELLLVGWLLLAGLGMLVQFRARATEKKQDKRSNGG